ncbi:transglycosylase SLT domain-containing protein [Caulobacter sp. 17J65-9]|uniref:transglycosylase SLT domain-containing protein n=1 Tax=Caulobacter sp. 17J65-9 TaxID=2709382 RepID=UPI0013CD5F93|nr:transglycosylase SLT domain-containing protein [Caulobacter sp. 17J65-9]NEX94534.1 transglycosylase SLT domain-containing protein [Caulobacter sp. 17J65-9]
MTIGKVGFEGAGVEAAIRRASNATGVDFEFLLKTAKRESALNPRAKAGSSSASGLFQFVDQTWLATLKKHGAKHGLGAYADQIQQGADGKLRVSGAARRAVMDLRFDAHASSLMAGELAADHAAYLRGRTGREPTAGELYAAHFLGPAGAAKLVEAADRQPGLSAARLFPDAAQANRSIFYRDGRPVSVAEVYANLTRTGGGAPAVDPDAVPSGEPELDGGNFMLAQRLDRLNSDRDLLGLMLGGDGQGSAADTLFTAQLLSAFGPDEDERA